MFTGYAMFVHKICNVLNLYTMLRAFCIIFISLYGAYPVNTASEPMLGIGLYSKLFNQLVGRGDPTPPQPCVAAHPPGEPPIQSIYYLLFLIYYLYFCPAKLSLVFLCALRIDRPAKQGYA